MCTLDRKARLDRLNASAVLQAMAGCSVWESLRLARRLTAEEYAALARAGAETMPAAGTLQRVRSIRLAAMVRSESVNVA